jgi:GNAT superfamily N-acetyltransferase
MNMIADTLYAKYISERDGTRVLETQWGFVTYGIEHKECFIANMFVDESVRTAGRGRELIGRLTEIALGQGCEYITGTINTKKPGATNTTIAALNVGFEIASADQGVLIIVKKLKGA